MEFPHKHQHHNSHRKEEEERPPIYPPPPLHHHQGPHTPFSPPLPLPVIPTVQHVAHETHQSPHHPSPSPSHQHHRDATKAAFVLPKGQDVRVFCQAETDFSLTIRNGSVVLAPTKHNDPFQHWIKDEKYSTKVKDEESFPSFALVNKATGQALQHSIGDTQPVRLTPYHPDVFDESILWTLSKDLGNGFRTIRMVNNIRLNLDAFNGDKNHGGVHDGTVVVLWQWKKDTNQRWKLVPY